MAEITRVLAENTLRQFFFVFTITASIVYSQTSCAFPVSISVIHVKSCLKQMINYPNLNWILDWYDCSVIVCACPKLKERKKERKKESSFPCTRAISEAMRQNSTWSLRIDFARCLVKNFQLICYSQRANVTWQWVDSGSSGFSKWQNDRLFAGVKHRWLFVL